MVRTSDRAPLPPYRLCPGATCGSRHVALAQARTPAGTTRGCTSLSRLRGIHVHRPSVIGPGESPPTGRIAACATGRHTRGPGSAGNSISGCFRLLARGVQHAQACVGAAHAGHAQRRRGAAYASAAATPQGAPHQRRRSCSTQPNSRTPH
jgi:hypothetical protein